MKKILILLACTIMCGVLLTGCGGGSGSGQKEETIPAGRTDLDQALVGSWEEDTSDELLTPLGDGWVFKADGTGDQLLYEASFTYSDEDGTIHVVFDELWDDTTTATLSTDQRSRSLTTRAIHLFTSRNRSLV